MRIGVTGPIAAGKSVVSRLLARHPGIEVIDADSVAHELMARHPDLAGQIAMELGDPALVGPEGLNRKRTAEIVFSDPSKLEILNRLVRPPLIAELRKRMHDSRQPHQILDAALLLDWPIKNELEGILLVWAEPETRLQRLIRKGKDASEARKRMESQGDWPSRRSQATWIIVNDGSPAELETKVDRWWQDRLREKDRK